MVNIPKAGRPVLEPLAVDFSSRVFSRVVVLAFAAILTTGRRTIANVLRTVQSLAAGSASTYHRVLSRRRWAEWQLARALATLVLQSCVPSGVVACCGDDTVDEHRGKKVYGKGCHRDAVRSAHSHTAFRWGHKWIVLCILVKLPFSTRTWALVVLLYLQLPQRKRRTLVHWSGKNNVTFSTRSVPYAAGCGSNGLLKTTAITSPLQNYPPKHNSSCSTPWHKLPDSSIWAKVELRKRS
jgi:hypothetical protein